MVNVANSYTFEVGDQDILNYVINKKVIILPCKWNFIAGHFILDRKGIFNDFKGEGNQPYWYYTREEMKKFTKFIYSSLYSLCCKALGELLYGI